MSCKNVNSRMLAYLDEELDEVSRKQFEEHISFCKECKETLIKMEIVYKEIDEEKNDYVHNHFFAAKVQHKINSSRNELAPIFTLKRTAIAYLAVAGVFVGIVVGTIFSSFVFNAHSNTEEQTWNQLAEEYFPYEYYEPFDDLSENSK